MKETSKQAFPVFKLVIKCKGKEKATYTKKGYNGEKGEHEFALKIITTRASYQKNKLIDS